MRWPEEEEASQELISKFSTLREQYYKLILPEGYRMRKIFGDQGRQVLSAIVDKDYEVVRALAPLVIFVMRLYVEHSRMNHGFALSKIHVDLSLLHEVRRVRILCEGMFGWDKPNDRRESMPSYLGTCDPDEIRLFDITLVKQRLRSAGEYPRFDASEELPGRPLADRWLATNTDVGRMSERSESYNTYGNGDCGGPGSLPTVGGGHYEAYRSGERGNGPACIQVDGREYAIESSGYGHYTGRTTQNDDAIDVREINIDDSGRITPRW